MTAQTAADLRAAADVLERDGWTRGSYHAPNGCHCAIGAIEVATGDWQDGHYTYEPGGPRLSSAWGALTRHLGCLDPGAIFPWNDAEERTADEVIAALRAAADAAEAGAPMDTSRP